MEKYRDWNILESLPEGWVIDDTAGSPAPNTVFITNGISPLKGQKRALLKINKKQQAILNEQPLVDVQKMQITNLPKEENYNFPYKTVNDLARLKFKEQILKEINFDLMVCEIEGWDKKEYIKELQKLLNSIYISKKKTEPIVNKQQSLFDALT